MKKKFTNWRPLVLVVVFFILFLLILLRLFYWQVLASEKLLQLAKNQYHSQEEIMPNRGEILATDGFPLVTNKKAYLLYSALGQLDKPSDEVAETLAPLLIEPENVEASLSAGEKEKLTKNLIKDKEEDLKTKLSLDLSWIILEHKLSEEIKEKIKQLEITGLGFENESTRFYPEASMAAHLLGFVGKNETGLDTGYFGLEGFYDMELRGRQGVLIQEKDAANRPILVGFFSTEEKKDGQNLVLHLDRTVQFIVEQELEKAVKRYGAKSGSVIIMDPNTGGIIAMASWPKFEPQKYFKSDKTLFKNPLISDTYEPGSTFKIFVMAAALDSEAVEKETKCDVCDHALKIDKYEIKNWNDKYHPQSTMDEIIQHSDNIGMVFVSRKLGLDNFLKYIKDFGFGQETNIDLQGEAASPLRPDNQWSEVDLATAAFGQGITVTGIQMVQACSVIANGGWLIEPQVVKKVISGKEEIEMKVKKIRQVIKPKTARIVKEMMVQAVDKGEASYLKKKIPGFKIAGKTGTAQIPVAGHYDEEKTIASFIGFAPADKPRLVMLTSLREPESSPWGSETAAPLFFNIAKQLFPYYGIQPE